MTPYHLTHHLYIISEFGADFNGKDQQSGYKGNAFVIGVRTKNVTFYNKQRDIITIPYSVFVKLGSK